MRLIFRHRPEQNILKHDLSFFQHFFKKEKKFILFIIPVRYMISRGKQPGFPVERGDLIFLERGE